MSVDVLLLALRAITSALLLGFVGAVFVVLWRDYRLASGVGEGQRRRGRLIVIQAGPDDAPEIHDAPENDDAPGDAPDDAPGDMDQPTLSGESLGGVDLIGASFPLLPLTSLGRAPTNTIVLNDTFCSQEHALVTRRGGQWWLEDRGSSNGTRLNGLPVAEPVVLSSGDVIGIGRVQLKIELE